MRDRAISPFSALGSLPPGSLPWRRGGGGLRVRVRVRTRALLGLGGYYGFVLMYTFIHKKEE